MRILDPIIPPSTTLMTVPDPEIASGGAIGPHVVGDQPIGNEAISLLHLMMRRLSRQVHVLKCRSNVFSAWRPWRP
jgi:hypothetical protein